MPWPLVSDADATVVTTYHLPRHHHFVVITPETCHMSSWQSVCTASSRKRRISKEADKPKLQTFRMAIPRNKYLWADNEWQKGIILTATKSWLHTETWHKRHNHDDCDTLNYLSRKDIEENTYRAYKYWLSALAYKARRCMKSFLYLLTFGTLLVQFKRVTWLVVTKVRSASARGAPWRVFCVITTLYYVAVLSMSQSRMLRTLYFSSSSVLLRAFSARCVYSTFRHHPHP